MIDRAGPDPSRPTLSNGEARPRLGSMTPTVDPLIFAGSASMLLGTEIAEYLQLPLGRGEVVQ
jgi:hypothetical protein